MPFSAWGVKKSKNPREAEKNVKSGWALKRAQFEEMFLEKIVRANDIRTSPAGAKYWILAALRILITFLPQPGYIHPDEFMQTLEPIAGSILDVEWTHSWEFNNSFPLRNMALSHLCIGVPIKILHGFSDLSKYYFDFAFLTPYTLLVFPRLIYCLLSFINDYCLFKICKLYGESFSDRLFFLASSYVTIVYATHTFSNSLEMILLSMLLFLVSDCMLTAKCVIEHNEALTDKYQKATNVVEKVKLYKLKKLLPEYSLSKCLQIATLSIVGMFNRPTFIAFAFPSVFLWLTRGLGSKYIGLKDFHVRLLVFVICCLPSLFFLIIMDSTFYGYLTISDIESQEISIENFVVTPVNFLRYNLFVDNLAAHGLHPRWLHVLVNIPILFNILGIIGLISIIRMSYKLCKGLYGSMPKIQSVPGLMTFSVICPVAVLSLFPHQEPRFLIPVLLPIVYLYTKNMNHIKTDTKFKKKLKSFSFVIWCFCNIFLSIFFGFIHQGGVYSVANHIHREINSRPRYINIHAITSHIYNIPQSLILSEDPMKIFYNRETGQKYKLAKQVFLYELGSKPLTNVIKEVQRVWNLKEVLKKTRVQEMRLYLFLPSSLKKELAVQWASANVTHLTLIEDTHFYPHLSTEALPYFPSEDDPFCNNIVHRLPDVSVVGKMTILEQIYCFIQQFSLVMYKIESNSRYIV